MAGGAARAGQNPYEERARTLKAAYISDVCIARGLTAAQIRELRPDERRDIEREAQTRAASDATWTQVAALVEHSRRRTLDPVPLDPF